MRPTAIDICRGRPDDELTVTAPRRPAIICSHSCARAHIKFAEKSIFAVRASVWCVHIVRALISRSYAAAAAAAQTNACACEKLVVM